MNKVHIYIYTYLHQGCIFIGVIDVNKQTNKLNILNLLIVQVWIFVYLKCLTPIGPYSHSTFTSLYNPFSWDVFSLLLTFLLVFITFYLLPSSTIVCIPASSLLVECRSLKEEPISGSYFYSRGSTLSKYLSTKWMS